MNSKESRHMDPLGIKFRHFERGSSRADFGTFEVIENNKKTGSRLAFHIMISILFFSLISIVVYDINSRNQVTQNVVNESITKNISDNTITQTNQRPLKSRETNNDSKPSFVDENPLSMASEIRSGNTRPESDEREILIDQDTDKNHITRIAETSTGSGPNKIEVNKYVENFAPFSIGLHAPELPLPSTGALIPTKVDKKSIIDIPAFRPMITVAYGIHSTGQTFSASRSNASEYVPAGLLTENKKALRRSYESWFTIRYNQSILKRTTLSVGLGYIASGVRGTYQFEVDSFPVYDVDDKVAGYVHVNDSLKAVVNTSASRKYEYLRIPVGFRTNFGLRPRWTLRAGMDASLDILLNARGSILDERDISAIRDIKNTNLRPFNISWNLNTSVLYSVSSNWQLGLQFDFDKNILSNSTGNYYNQKNSGYGFGIISTFRL